MSTKKFTTSSSLPRLRLPTQPICTLFSLFSKRPFVWRSYSGMFSFVLRLGRGAGAGLSALLSMLGFVHGTQPALDRVHAGLACEQSNTAATRCPQNRHSHVYSCTVAPCAVHVVWPHVPFPQDFGGGGVISARVAGRFRTVGLGGLDPLPLRPRRHAGKRLFALLFLPDK